MASALTKRSTGSSDDKTELIIATVALAISLFALVCAVFQALNQYFATATGITSCKPEVMGDWAQFTHRLLRLFQFRIEVQFRVPVIFVAPPTNKRGPLGQNKPIFYVDGTADSCAKTHTWTVEEFDRRQDARRDAGDTRETIHTADSELVSWAALLMAAQRMERESAEWQQQIIPTFVPLFSSTESELPESRHTLAIGIQEQTRSWDTMPNSLKKPYATSAMCHLIEIMAMLGVYWREFDMSSNTFRAQGNGFNLTGTMVDSLGYAFTFHKTGKTWFQENRIVPNDSVKQLCFGFCPTIFGAGLKTTLYTDEPKDERTLQLANRAEVAEMLVSFGCNTNTVNYFRLSNEHTRYSHLFPIPFEMLGMVGELLQIKHTAFTMLPNPTFFSWNKAAFSLIKLLQNFNEAVEQFSTKQGTGPTATSNHIPRVLKAVRNVLSVAVDDDNCKKKQRQKDIEHQLQQEVTQFGISRMLPLGSQGPANDTGDAEAEAGIPPWLRTLRSAIQWLCRWLFTLIGRTLVAVRVPAGERFLPKSEPQIELRQLAPGVQERATFGRLLETLHVAIQDCDIFLSHNHSLVKHVFVLHVQEIMAYLNEFQDATSGRTADGGHSPTSPGGLSSRPADWTTTRRLSRVEPSSGSSSATAGAEGADTVEPDEPPLGYVPLHVIDTASWDERHQHLMQLYVLYVRERVRSAPIPDHLQNYQEATEWPGRPQNPSLMFSDQPLVFREPVLTPDRTGQANDTANPGTATESRDGIELDPWQSGEQTPVRPVSPSIIITGGDPRPSGSRPTAAATASGVNTSGVSHLRVPGNTVGGASATSGTGAGAAVQAERNTGVPNAEAAKRRRRRTPHEPLSTVSRSTKEQDIDDIWCTLTFRMICWLMLHDFHRKDVQVSKSDMLDSRMPVYFL